MTQTARILEDWSAALAQPVATTMADRARAIGVPVASYQAIVRASPLPRHHPAAAKTRIADGLDRWHRVLTVELPAESLRAVAVVVGVPYSTMRLATAEAQMPLVLERRVKATVNPHIAAGLARWRRVIAADLPLETLADCARATGCRYLSLRLAAQRCGLPTVLGA